MRKLSSLIIVPVSIIVVMALVLGGCSGGSSTTPAATNAHPPASTMAPPTSNAAPPASSQAPAPPTSSAAPPASSAPPASTAAGTIKVGVIASMSGFFATMAQYMVPGAQMAADKENASGGVLGKQVEVITRDDQGDPSLISQRCAELKSAGAVGIVGTFMDAADTALDQWGNENHVIISGSTETTIASRTTKFSKYVFYAAPLNTATSNVFFQSISKQSGIKSIYYISGDVLVGHDIYNTFWSLMKQANSSVTNLGSTFVGAMETDFSSQISAIMAKKPDMIISGCGGPQWPAFIKQGVQFGLFKNTKLAAIYGLDASTSTPLGKDTPEGIQGVIYCPFFLNTPAMQAFQTDYANRVKGQYVNDLTVEYYNATYALLEGIKKANSTDPEKISAAMETLTLDTPLGTCTMDAYDHQLEVPIWWGTTQNVPEYPIVTATNLVKYQQGIYPTQDQIKALSSAK